MTDNDDNLQRDPEDWKTGNNPMTDAQRVYLDTLAGQAGEPSPNESLTATEASERIEDLRKKTGLGNEDE